MALAAVERRYRDGAVRVEHVDGVSIEYPGWRFNLRASNTEPVLRLNVESRGDPALLRTRTRTRTRTAELLRLLDGFA